MQNTALLQKHLDANAKMVDFAGFYMPVSYEGIKAEHKTVREQVGVFDVSHMGEFVLKGKNALQLIQYITTNDASKLYDGKVQYTCMPNGKNGIVDDLLVYRYSQEEYYLVVNASNIAKDLHWIETHNQAQNFGVEITNISDQLSLLAVQILLGALTVWKLLDPSVVSGHLGVALLIFVTPLVSPGTSTGVLRWVVVPSPSWP